MDFSFCLPESDKGVILDPICLEEILQAFTTHLNYDEVH
jgi:hypothetical protein